ncbi:MAG TPA: glycoside hydrolase family 18 protein [Thermoanaerobaculia bacterium]|nr:glycoside hydrolase family 18 protein [Thermoanaerobaculia bacterium]
MNLRTIAIGVAVLAAGCRTAQPRIIAYVYKDAEIARISAEKLTHINYAFALVSENGEVVLADPDAARIAQMQSLKAKNPRLKILLSVGGWGADHFSDAALTDASRKKFAASAVALLKQHALDGIDLDWEYPGQPGPGIKYRAEDKRNFTLLLREMREQLGNRALLTIASSAGEYFEHTEMDKLHVHLDWINIMTYDFAGSWTPTTGHHAALYNENGPSGESFVRQHLAAGIPPSKLVLGVPFYGRGWTGVHPENHGFAQKWTSAAEFPWSELSTQTGFERHWDPIAKAPFLWNPESRTFVSYDDPESLRIKAQFVREHGLGGLMYWEHSHDPNEELLDVLVQGVGAHR